MAAPEIKDVVRWVVEDGHFKYGGIDIEVWFYSVNFSCTNPVFRHVLMISSNLLVVKVSLTFCGWRCSQLRVVPTLRSSETLLLQVGLGQELLLSCSPLYVFQLFLFLFYGFTLFAD